jgi:hypothetical protein
MEMVLEWKGSSMIAATNELPAVDLGRMYFGL